MSIENQEKNKCADCFYCVRGYCGSQGIYIDIDNNFVCGEFNDLKEVRKGLIKNG